MSDYIKREDAIKALEGLKISGEMILATVPSADVVEVDKVQKEIDYWHDKAQSYEQTILKLSLNKADVFEVVRCDQCRHFEAINNDDHGWCKLISDLPIGVSVRYHDDFCSYGERADT